jgi:hypothetical protein
MRFLSALTIIKGAFKMKKFAVILSLSFISTITYAQAPSSDALAKGAINQYLLIKALGGAMPGPHAPAKAEECGLAKNALIGLGLLHGKSDAEIALLLSFPGIAAKDIAPIAQILAETELDCVNQN